MTTLGLQELTEARDAPISLYAAAAAFSDATEFFPAAVSTAAHMERFRGHRWGTPEVSRILKKDQFAEILGTCNHQRSGLHEVLLRRLSFEEFGALVPDTSLPSQEFFQLLSASQAPGASLESPGRFHPLRQISFTGVRLSALRSKLVTALAHLQKLAADAQLAAGSLQISCSTISFQVVRSHGTTWLHLGDPGLEIRSSPDNAAFAKEIAAMLQSEAPSMKGILPLKAFCTARAAAHLMAGPDIAEDLTSPLRSEGYQSQHPQLQHAHREAWLSRLAATHEFLLYALGFQNLDPGSCWDGKMFTFAACCSVGEYFDSCWHGGFSDERCCHPLRAPELGGQDRAVAFWCCENVNMLNVCHAFFMLFPSIDVGPKSLDPWYFSVSPHGLQVWYTDDA